MSEISQISPIDQYYAGQPADVTVIEHGRQESQLAVVARWPFSVEVSDCIANAVWQVYDDPKSTNQFEALVFNPGAQGPTIALPTTYGEYNPGNMYEGGLWAAQNPDQRLVLLPRFNLSFRELEYYAKTGRLTDDAGGPLPSMWQLSRALTAAGIEVTGVYARSAGTKEGSVLPQVMPSIKSVVMGAPPQISELSTLGFVSGGLAENSKQRLARSGYMATDVYQLNNQRRAQLAEARKDRPDRQRPTGKVAAIVGNAAVRAAHTFGLSKGPGAFMADLRDTKAAVDLVVYTGDALYGRQGIPASLGRVATEFEGYGDENARRMRVIPVGGGHRIPERYPLFTNDMADALLRS